ncbi:hypothetical protein [uncultured Gimesia sp.]|uniref:hypothetical protein n=1 Tax=uncultured Gimesia sp. TaxID=1678688 RepID=UPI0030D94CB1|tara:strand:+ start:1867 stop:2295 length:429 start_codon:yes stop_codon:yes gene_type:complete
MTSKQRTEILSSISIANVADHHDWLRWCFQEELKARLSEKPCDHFENIYHCALLLHVIGDLSDLPLMYRAKCSGDMDLGIGFDWQFLFFNQPSVLKNYADSVERADIAKWIEDYQEDYKKEDMSLWLKMRIKYFDVPQVEKN